MPKIPAAFKETAAPASPGFDRPVAVSRTLWSKRRIEVTVRWKNGREERGTVAALVFGSVCVFRWKGDDEWTVGLVEQDRRLVTCKSEEAALELGQWLQREWCLELRGTPEEIVAKLPPWTKEWLAKCSASGCWLPPPVDAMQE